MTVANQRVSAQIEKLLYTFEETRKTANISLGMIRKLAKSGELKVVHIGRAVRVPRAEVMRLCGME